MKNLHDMKRHVILSPARSSSRTSSSWSSPLVVTKMTVCGVLLCCLFLGRMHPPLLAVVASPDDEVLVVDGDEANHRLDSSSSSTMYHHHQYQSGKKTNHHHHVRQSSSFPEMEMDEKTVQRNLQLLERQQQGRMKQQHQQQQQKGGEAQEQTQPDPNKTELEKEFKTSDRPKYRDDTFDFDNKEDFKKELEEDVDEEKLAFYGPPLPPPPGGPFSGYGAICPYRCMHSILHARRCKAYFPTCGGYFGWCAPEDDFFLGGGYDGY